MLRHWIDDAYESCDRWMGCIVCPTLGAGGENDMVNLLEHGETVSFYKLKNGDGEARYSRKTSVGVRLPTELSACPERWSDVSAEIARWAWNGGSIIVSARCKSKEKGNKVDKVMMCTRWRSYQCNSTPQASTPSTYSLPILHNTSRFYAWGLQPFPPFLPPHPPAPLTFIVLACRLPLSHSPTPNSLTYVGLNLV